MQQDATERSPITNCYFADVNSKIKNPNEDAVSKALLEMQTEKFKDALNADDPANGWIVRKNETPLCGAEPADYSAVDAALAKIPADLAAYTDETVTALNNAKANVVKGKVLAKQSEVDDMAKAIEDAIAALVKKPSSSGDFSSGVFFPSYPVTIPDKTENGTVTVSTKIATSGSTVTITVKPDSGYTLETLIVTDKNGNELKLTNKGDGKYTFTMPASMVTVTATFMDDNTMLNFFYDVPNNAYYFDAVKWAVENGITGGVGGNLFAPNSDCTRAQIVTFLWRAAGSPAPKTMSTFADVPADAYYAKAVAWAVENGVAGGTGNGLFSPDAPCTRAQAVTFLWHAAGSPEPKSVSTFADVPADAYYAKAIAWAVENGITTGVGGGRFDPNATCTRAQIVTFLFRAYQDQ